MKLTFERWINHWGLSYRFLKGSECAVRVEVWDESYPVGCVWGEGDTKEEAKEKCVEQWGQLDEA